MTDFSMHKKNQIKQTLFCLLNKQIDLKDLFICGGPCHLSSSVLGPYCPLKTPCLFSHENIKIMFSSRKDYGTPILNNHQ